MNKQMLGLLGSAVLFVGVFMPIVSVPIMGSVNYFQNGRGDGTVVLGFALVALFMVNRKFYRLLWIPGFGSLAVLALTFWNIQSRLSEMRSSMSKELADNPFRGLAEAMTGTVQLQWGWAVLVVGSVLLLLAAFSAETISNGGGGAAGRASVPPPAAGGS